MKTADFPPPEILARQPKPTRAISLFHWNNFNVYLCITVLALNVYCSYKWHLRKLIKKTFSLIKTSIMHILLVFLWQYPDYSFLLYDVVYFGR
jgi:hypothetical protein